MNPYLGARFFHILGAVVCLGAIICLPLLAAAWRRHAAVSELDRALDRLVGAGGWALVLSGVALLYLRGWSDTHAPWFLGAMGMLAFALVLEKVAERRAWVGNAVWAWGRVALYIAILGLMVYKP